MKELFLLNEDIRQYETVVVYGAGAAGRALLLKLLQRGVKVACFADTHPKQCGTLYLNIPIVHIDELARHRESAAMIVSGRYAFEVAAELEKRGWKNMFFDYGNEVNIIHLDREEA